MDTGSDGRKIGRSAASGEVVSPSAADLFGTESGRNIGKIPYQCGKRLPQMCRIDGRNGFDTVDAFDIERRAVGAEPEGGPVGFGRFFQKSEKPRILPERHNQRSAGKRIERTRKPRFFNAVTPFDARKKSVGADEYRFLGDKQSVGAGGSR